MCILLPSVPKNEIFLSLKSRIICANFIFVERYSSTCRAGAAGSGGTTPLFPFEVPEDEGGADEVFVAGDSSKLIGDAF